MTGERCVLPVKCRRCGAVFDLWYDLQAQEQLRGGGLAQKNSALMNLLGAQAFCWDCRKEEVDVAFEENEPEEYNLMLNSE